MPLFSEKWRSRLIRYVPLVLWIGVILSLSSGLGSMSNTSRFIRPILQFLFPQASEETIQLIHGYIRKLAHLTEYAILAFLSSRALISSSISFLRNYWFLATFILVVFVAIADETNQSFTTSRTASLTDLLLDCLGGLIAIFAFFIIKKRLKIFR